MTEKAQPWLDYSGQTTAEILAFKSTHRIDSLLCALEEGILLRQSRRGRKRITSEERVLLAVMALDREVNNGGYHQFFLNSSVQYAPIIVRTLKRIGCTATAALTEKAIDALRLEKVTAQSASAAILTSDPKRDGILNGFDKQFYKLGETEQKLFAFVESFQHKILLARTAVPKREATRGFTNVTVVLTYLESAPKMDRSLDAVRRLAKELATRNSVVATDEEIDGAAYLYLFNWHLRSGNLTDCATFADSALKHAGENTTHCVAHRKWAEKLLEAENYSLADSATLQYLEYLNGDDKPSKFIQNRIAFWADLVRRHLAALPQSVEFFRANFPDVSLDPPRRSKPPR